MVRNRPTRFRTSIAVVASGFLLAVGMSGLAEAGNISLPGNEITIPNGAPGVTMGPSDPYPSTTTANWCQGSIQDVNISFFITHGATGDLDFLLVGPGGQNALIASDSGGNTDITDEFITLDDEAASPLPNPWTSGDFQPTNLSGGADVLDPPAPTPSGGSALSVFDGTSPIGTWRLSSTTRCP